MQMKTFLTTVMCFLAVSASSSLAFDYDPEGRRETNSRRYEICSEIAHELNNAVANGQIKSSQAQEVISRCFQEFI